MTVKVISAGLQTTIQDSGRPGLRHRGIPESGAADPLSFISANRRLGVPDNQPALEITLQGPELEFGQGMTLSYAGAPADIKKNEAVLNPAKPFSVQKGDRLTIGTLRGGVRGYLAFSTAVKAQHYAGSASTFIPGGFGGHQGRSLKAGDKLEFEDPLPLDPAPVPAFAHAHLSRLQILRVCPGPEWEWLTAASQKKLFSKPFVASASTNRIGARLGGPKLALKSKAQMVSSGLLPGTLQLPQGGAPILSLVDSHCTGGYARVLKIIEADLYRLGQIGPGTEIWFTSVTRAEAAAITKTHQIYLKR